MSTPEIPEPPKLDLTHPVAAARLILTDQRFRYLIVGGINTVLSLGLFIGLDAWFGPGVPSFVPLTLAWAISVVCVFFAQRALVFKVTGHLWRDLFRFVLVNSGALGINLVLLFLVADLLGAPRVPAQLVITVGTVILSYLGHKHFSFSRKPSVTAAEESGPSAAGQPSPGDPAG